MADSLDNLDLTSITGETFYVPTIFIPIPELDATCGFVADLSNFVSQQVWTFVYPERILQPGASIGSTTYKSGLNLDGDGNPVLSLQKLHFIYDPLAVLFTPNDLAHKYPLVPKQRILALTNDQIWATGVATTAAFAVFAWLLFARGTECTGPPAQQVHRRRSGHECCAAAAGLFLGVSGSLGMSVSLSVRAFDHFESGYAARRGSHHV